MRSLYLTLLLLVSLGCRLSDAIFCYVCESVRDFRCLDPFDYQPFVQVGLDSFILIKYFLTHLIIFLQIDCSTLPFVRDKVPVFCEKRTEVFNGEYVTTRGCSVDYRWEDVQGYRDISGEEVVAIESLKRRSIRRSVITETAPTRAFSRLKAPKTLC